MAVLGLCAEMGICRAAEPAPTKDEQIAKLEARQAELEKELSGLEERLAKRYRLMPSATLWITPDCRVYRTAVPEYGGKSLTWDILYNGVHALSRSASNEYKLDLFPLLEKRSGTYVVYLTLFVDGAYRPISNVISFYLPEKEGEKSEKKSSDAKKTAPTLVLEARTLEERIGQMEDRMSEWRANQEQQRTLPTNLTVWMDWVGNVRRSVGPEAMEDNIVWEFGGTGHLGRNAKGETVFALYWRDAGDYTAATSAGSNELNSNRLTIRRDDQGYLTVVKNEDHPKGGD